MKIRHLGSIRLHVGPVVHLECHSITDQICDNAMFTFDQTQFGTISWGQNIIQIDALNSDIIYTWPERCPPRSLPRRQNSRSRSDEWVLIKNGQGAKYNYSNLYVTEELTYWKEGA